MEMMPPNSKFTAFLIMAVVPFCSCKSSSDANNSILSTFPDLDNATKIEVLDEQEIIQINKISLAQKELIEKLTNANKTRHHKKDVKMEAAEHSIKLYFSDGSEWRIKPFHAYKKNLVYTVSNGFTRQYFEHKEWTFENFNDQLRKIFPHR